MSRPPPWLFWNASASVPVGLYLRVAGPPSRGALALARLPRPYLALAAGRGYLPAGVPLIKRIAGVGGDILCRRGPVLTLNGRVRAMARAADAEGRALPVWRGCRRLKPGELVLLARVTESFDSRYFGPLAPDELIGVALPIWLAGR